MNTLSSEFPPAEREASGSPLKGALLCFILSTQTLNFRYLARGSESNIKPERPTSNIEGGTPSVIIIYELRKTMAFCNELENLIPSCKIQIPDVIYPEPA